MIVTVSNVFSPHSEETQPVLFAVFAPLSLLCLYTSGTIESPPPSCSTVWM